MHKQRHSPLQYLLIFWLYDKHKIKARTTKFLFAKKKTVACESPKRSIDIFWKRPGPEHYCATRPSAGPVQTFALEVQA
jgi:hypothetical protein